MLLIRPIKPWAFLEEVTRWDKEELKKMAHAGFQGRDMI
jgi:hypothetical protein